MGSGVSETALTFYSHVRPPSEHVLASAQLGRSFGIFKWDGSNVFS